ncbi:glycoside hydrolase family 127 protein [Mangrovimonas sp. AS39]|uniref:glycoside hydrolase family 127 protein n=1 Tax=Mangrovimonas futianensis TaxID=2895523 RepID=UPI001E4D8519|nr:beta-L-arabinofuranosidase domain-containing protein [Mangrovimonas futianensis]MCF1190893.1 glycoside hydrolase family 127 protein [Mangrovimonas futianensis]MCF1194589.1 glycoside hydrolase family 127 protein [Mangrovimonas futianensis]
MKRINQILIFGVSLLIFNCNNETQVTGVEEPGSGMGYPIEPVDIQHVKVTDEFWLPIIKRVQEKTIDYAIAKCEEEGRFDNFLIAGGQMKGEVRGEMPFDDTDVYKIIEGASNSLISAPNKELETLVDSLVSIIKVGQEKDGYLTTWRTIDPAKPPATWVQTPKGERWDGLFMSHELYNAGHLYEAAAVHYRATGKRNFLDIAIKNADLMVKTFGDEEGKIKAVPGHQIIESGLIKLYQITGNEEYINLAKYFLDNRGNPENHELFGPYSQDSIPVTQQEEVVGHSVRAVYMYAAMTDIAAIQNDSLYEAAVNKLWNNMVSKKMYITGGIGAKHEGEQFGANYELPNLTAYNETCAAIGDVYWNHRMHNLYGDVKYFDVIERTLYNGLISGLSLDGTNFFYPNALESDGVYKSNRGSCTRQAWFDCSCCPTNVIRFVPSIPGLIYSKGNNSVYVNLYASNEAEIDLDGKAVKVTQNTSYPWNGTVNMTVEADSEVTVKFRVPGWSRNEVLPSDLYSYANSYESQPTLSINGEKVETAVQDGYLEVTRNWSADDTIEIHFPMEVRAVKANENVEEDRGKLSLEYGPLVYAVEEVDNPNFDTISVSANDQFSVQKEDILEGVNTISNNQLKAIPYYAWSNRGVNKMKVWLPETKNNN